MHSLGEVLRRRPRSPPIDARRVRRGSDLPARPLAARLRRLREDLDLHHEIKSFAAVAGLSTQFLQESRALSYFDRCSVAWRLESLSTRKPVARHGGLPQRRGHRLYRLYAIRGGTTDKFVTCCSQVFDADGGGGRAGVRRLRRGRDGVDFENPFLSRADMRAVMSRSLAVYQVATRDACRAGSSSTRRRRFRDEEVDGRIDAWDAPMRSRRPGRRVERDRRRAVRLLGARTGWCWKTPDFAEEERGTPSSFSDRSVLLFINGDAPSGCPRVRVQGGKGDPAADHACPPRRGRAAGEAWEDALALSKTDWNNDALFDSLPVTIEYLEAPVPDDRPRNIASERNLPLPPVHVRRRAGMAADRDEKGRFG